MKRGDFLWLIIPFILTGCGAGPVNDEVENQDSLQTEEVEVIESKPGDPKEIIEQDGIALEIYDFENFEPFLQQNDDKIHVINFWATWCIPCVQELPYFEALGEKYPEIDLVLVSLDFRKVVETELIPFIIDRQLKSEVLMLHEPDANSWIPKVNEDWSGAIPATVIYKGQQREFYEQSFTFEELESEIEKFK